MIPFILATIGGYLIGNSHRQKFGYGDVVKDKTISEGDEVVFQMKRDTWIEIFDDNDDVVSEEQFQSGEMFEVVVYEITDLFYLSKLPDGNNAAFDKNEVEIVAINDEVAAYKKGGMTKKWIQGAIKKPGALREEAKKQGLIKGDEKLSKTDLDKLEKMGGKTAQRARLAKTLKKMRNGGEIYEEVNVNGEKAYVSPSDTYYTGSKFEGYFDNYSDDYPVVYGDTKEEVIENLKDQLENPPPFREYYER